MTTKSYLIYTQGEDFPEIFNFLKEHAEEGKIGVLENKIFTLSSTQPLDYFDTQIKTDFPKSNFLIVEAADFVYSGPGEIASAAGLLHR